MENRNEFQFRSNNTWGGLIVLIVLLVLLFFIARGIFKLLSFVAPILLIAAAIIDHTVIVGSVHWLVKLLKRNVLIGLGAIVLSIVGFPVVSAFLLGRALMNRKVKSMERQARVARDGELIDYEELEPPVEMPRDDRESR
jgi:uncharacterized membrane protein YkvI